MTGRQQREPDNATRPEHLDPILECALAVFKENDAAITPDAATAGLPLRDGMVTPLHLPKVAQRAGFSCRMVTTGLSGINPNLLPAILLLKDEQACLIRGVAADGSSFKISYPDLPESVHEISRDDLADRYLGKVIYLRPRYRFDHRSPDVRGTSGRHWFWGVMLENRALYRDVLVAAFLISLFALAMPLFIRNVYDRVVPNHAVDTLWVLASGLAIVLIGDVILKTMRSYFLDLASKRIDVKLSSAIMEKVLGARLENKPLSAGSFAANLRSFETIRDFITSATVTAFIDLPFSIVFLVVIGLIAWQLTLPIIAGMLLVLVLAGLAQARMRDLAELTYRAGAQRNATLIESLVGLETLKALGSEGKMQGRWERSVAYLAQVSNRLRLLSAGTLNTASWTAQIVNVALIITGVYLISENQLTMGGLIACSMLSSRALAPLGQAAGLMTQYHHAATALHSLNEIMQQPSERSSEQGFLSRQGFKGAVELRKVSFAYPGQDMAVLRNVSLKIEAGERVGIIGRVGAGKSTLLRLVLGLYQPTDGNITIDGIDLRQVDPAELRRHIGYVSQDVTLFFGSLRENIAMARPDATDQEIIEAVTMAGLADYINNHPQGFDMLIGERGESLSGGQKQAVALARAFIKNPSVLLLDEPTGSMDHSSEEEIKKTVSDFSRGRTLLLTTHRTSLLELVDRIVVMDQGTIVADGPKEQVIQALRQGRIGKAG
ncbi:MAG: type I secretion system permease/ATPase [Geothermobacteraceae bacterium]